MAEAARAHLDALAASQLLGACSGPLRAAGIAGLTWFGWRWCSAASCRSAS